MKILKIGTVKVTLFILSVSILLLLVVLLIKPVHATEPVPRQASVAQETATPEIGETDEPSEQVSPEDEVVIYEVDVLEELPHDTGAYTQGLLLHEGSFYESTGRRPSTLREVDPETGDVLRLIELDEEYFAEGLALVDERLYQLTWTSEVVFVYDLETFELLETMAYEGEGWGLCYDGEYLYRSDGTEIIYVHDPETFELVDEITVRLFDLSVDEVFIGGRTLSEINELACVGDKIYANVWFLDLILRIDIETGQITGLIDAANLLPEDVRAELESQAVLNGIAYDEENEVFYLTGKLWPAMFQVEFIESSRFGPEAIAG